MSLLRHKKAVFKIPFCYLNNPEKKETRRKKNAHVVPSAKQ